MRNDTKWGARTFADKVIKKAVQEDIEKLALVVLGNHQLKVEFNDDGFDPYPYCNHGTKQYCPIGHKKMKYRGRWLGYVVHGHTRTDIYLEVLRCLANDNSLYFPIVSHRRDDEWVEREKVETYKEAH